MLLYDPVADAKAIIVEGHARFTVLTPQLIRMEWAADGKFENHASLVFLNRKLPVPKFTVMPVKRRALDFSTDAVRVHYAPANGSDGRFTADNSSVTLTLNGKQIGHGISVRRTPATSKAQPEHSTAPWAVKPRSRWIPV